MALGELPVADVADADHRLGFNGSGTLCSSLHDDCLHQASSAHHLQSGSRCLWSAGRDPADQVSGLFVFHACV